MHLASLFWVNLSSHGQGEKQAFAILWHSSNLYGVLCVCVWRIASSKLHLQETWPRRAPPEVPGLSHSWEQVSSTQEYSDSKTKEIAPFRPDPKSKEVETQPAL